MVNVRLGVQCASSILGGEPRRAVPGAFNFEKFASAIVDSVAAFACFVSFISWRRI